MTFLVAVTNFLAEAAEGREKVCFTSQCQKGFCPLYQGEYGNRLATEASYIGGTSKQTLPRPGAGYDRQWLDSS